VVTTTLSPVTPAVERSCGSCPTTGSGSRPSRPGLERIEAVFEARLRPASHDTYAIGYTVDGCSRSTIGARVRQHKGQVHRLHPDEVHDGRARASGGFRYRLLYIEPT